MAIDTKMKVSGLSQYKSQIKSAQQSVKQLDAELKLAEAQYQATGDKEQYAGKQTEILTKQIAQQERVVASSRAALQAMEKQGVDPASASYQRMQLQMTNAQTKLVTMQTQLNGSTGKFKDATKSVGEYQGALSSINTKVSFDAVISGIGGITSALENGIRKAARFAKQLWQFEAGATVWADELKTESDKTGIDVETLQRMRYASQIVDADVQDIITGMTKINALAQKSGGILTVYDGYMRGGFKNYVETSGKSELEVFWDVLDILKQIPDEGARDARAMELFGKSFRELNVLMGETAREDYAKAMEDAPIVSEDGVKQLTDANDALVTMQAEFEKLKTELAVEMAPIFKDVTEALTDMMREFSEWLKSDEGQEAIQKLKDGFQWLIDNKETVIDVLTKIGEALLALKIGEGVLKGLQLLNGLKGLFGGGKATASAAPAAGGSAGGGFMTAIKGGMATAAKAIAPYLGPVMALTAADAIGSAMWNREYAERKAKWGEDTFVSGWTQEQRALAEDYYKYYRLERLGEDPEAAGKSVLAYKALIQSLGGVSEEAEKFDMVLENLGLDEALPEDLPAELFQDMKDAAAAVTEGLTSQMGVFYSAGQAIAAAIQSGVSSVAMPRQSGMRNVVSNLYINTMNMANNNVQQLVNAIGNNLNRTRYAYGGSGGGF